MSNLLIYTTVADPADEIRFSVLYDEVKKIYAMPTLEVKHSQVDVIVSDSNYWIKEVLYPALKSWLARTMNEEERRVVDGFLKEGRISEDEKSVSIVVDIIDYAMENKMLEHG